MKNGQDIVKKKEVEPYNISTLTIPQLQKHSFGAGKYIHRPEWIIQNNSNNNKKLWTCKRLYNVIGSTNKGESIGINLHISQKFNVELKDADWYLHWETNHIIFKTEVFVVEMQKYGIEWNPQDSCLWKMVEGGEDFGCKSYGKKSPGISVHILIF